MALVRRWRHSRNRWTPRRLCPPHAHTSRPAHRRLLPLPVQRWLAAPPALDAVEPRGRNLGCPLVSGVAPPARRAPGLWPEHYVPLLGLAAVGGREGDAMGGGEGVMWGGGWHGVHYDPSGIWGRLERGGCRSPCAFATNPWAPQVSGEQVPGIDRLREGAGMGSPGQGASSPTHLTQWSTHITQWRLPVDRSAIGAGTVLVGFRSRSCAPAGSRASPGPPDWLIREVSALTGFVLTL